ncbi:transmembrane protein 79 [Puma concolor]|uniref:Transmembrane protein 79 n=1 Tax=Puma concolor TaxID=9696 RepID=A0A6P6H5M2_PUMCO|nr:transmembrane protein 79 [Puma concolor]
MTEPETLALLEVKGSEAPEKSPPQALVPNGRQPEGEGGAESCGAESSRAGSSAGSPTAEEGTEDGLDSTVSEAATLPWGTGPQPSAPFPDPPGWRDIEPEPLRSEPPTKLEELSEDDANLLPEKAARAFVPIDLQCIERRPQEDLVVRCEAGEGELIYWLTFAVGRSFRGFGYGLTFLPLLSMLVWNLYYMFVVEPERMLTAAESRLDYPDHARSASDHRLRPWG